MGISIVFFVLGVGSELFRLYQSHVLGSHPHKVIVHVYPNGQDFPDDVDKAILRQGLQIHELDTNLNLAVKEGDQLIVQLSSLTKRIESLQQEVSKLHEELAEATEGGVDDV